MRNARTLVAPRKFSSRFDVGKVYMVICIIAYPTKMMKQVALSRRVKQLALAHIT